MGHGGGDSLSNVSKIERAGAQMGNIGWVKGKEINANDKLGEREITNTKKKKKDEEVNVSSSSSVKQTSNTRQSLPSGVTNLPT